MEIYNNLADIKAPFRNSFVTIGNFDGVHLGHHMLFAEVVSRAYQKQGTSVVVTFDPHPLQVIRPEIGIKLISTYEQKVELISYAGIDWQQALTELQPALVAIGRRGGAHFDPIMVALVQGCHIYCDKPLAATAIHAKMLYQKAKEAGVKTATCALSPTKDGMRIEAQVTLPSTGGREVVIIEAGQPGLWSSETEVSRSGAILIAQGEILAADDAPLALDRSKIRITVLGDKYAVDIRGCTAR